MKNLFIPLLLLSLLATRCGNNNPMDMSKEADDIRQTDIEFSNFSKINGMKAAFLRYADSGTVLLRSNHNPITGKEAFEYIQSISDTSITLTWMPEAVQLAASGDLGYTYGVYNFTGKDTTYEGTYVTIWKKQPDGSWKFVLDSGNPGLGKKAK